MPRWLKPRPLVAVVASLLAFGAGAADGPGAFLPNMLPIPNASGLAATFSTQGRISLSGPFFQSLGTNGRACVSCHQPQAGWTITPENVQLRFDLTRGTDPIFRTERRLELARGRRVDARRASRRLQHAAQQGADPRRHRRARERRVRARGRRRSLRPRERERPVAIPPAAPLYQPRFPEHAHVGRARDLQGFHVDRLHSRHHELLRVDALRSRRPVQRRDDRPRPGSATRSLTEQREAYRRIRDDALHRADLRSGRRQSDGAQGAGRSRSI